MDVVSILEKAVERDASDVFIVAGTNVSFKIKGQLCSYNDFIMTPDDTKELIREIYTLAKIDKKIINFGEDDFSFSLSKLARFRVNVFFQRGSLAAVLRIVRYNLPNYHELSIPSEVIGLSNARKGLVLVGGSAGSGKSTTLACIIDQINKNRSAHIITIEDPIEYLHTHNKSIVSQREITYDTESYNTALKAALREAPDVILIGEMRDLETIQIALSAAETGHLVLSTLHTTSAKETVNRIIDVFPPEQQHQIRIQLSTTLLAVVCQQLLPTKDDNVLPAFEILVANNAIKTQIREGKIHQIDNYITSGKKEGMISMDDSILDLYNQNKITKEIAILYSNNQELMSRKING